MTFLKHRIGDPRLLRLIRKWLTIGVIEDGKRQRSTQGSAQGAVISPILANVYLHYVFDLWVNAWRGKRAKGQVIVIRYADDTRVGFQHKAEADQFLLQLKHRMQQFGLRLHAGKTKLLRFGPYAAAQCRALGQRKPPTLDFLGFTHYCTTARRMDWFVVGRKSQKTRLRRQLQALKQGLRQRLHAPIHATGQWLERVLQGHLNYYAVPGNGPSLQYFVKQATWYWWRSLRRRSQRHRMNWERFRPLVERYVPPIRILHAQPLHRFDARTQGKSPVR